MQNTQLHGHTGNSSSAVQYASSSSDEQSSAVRYSSASPAPISRRLLCGASAKWRAAGSPASTPPTAAGKRRPDISGVKTKELRDIRSSQLGISLFTHSCSVASFVRFLSVVRLHTFKCRGATQPFSLNSISWFLKLETCRNKQTFSGLFYFTRYLEPNRSIKTKQHPYSHPVKQLVHCQLLINC